MVKALDYKHPYYPDKSKEHKFAKFYEENELKKYSFALTRDPLCRMVSWFFFHNQTCTGKQKEIYDYDSFQDWFDDGLKTHWTFNVFSMKEWVTDKNNNTIVDDIFFLEEISKPDSHRWSILKDRLEANPNIKFPHEMRSHHKKYEKYFDKTRRQKAIDICKEDIDFFRTYSHEYNSTD